MLHKFSTWILFASAPVNSYSMPFSSFSFQSLFTYKQIVWIKSAIVCCHNKNSLLEAEHYGHKILMQWSSPVEVNTFLNATTATSFLARFPAKKQVGCTNASRDLNMLLPRTGRHLIPFPPLQRVYGRTLRHNHTFSDGWFTKFYYPWCSAGALRALELRYNLFAYSFDLGKGEIKCVTDFESTTLKISLKISCWPYPKLIN